MQPGPDMNALLQQAQQMQAQLAEAQQEIAASTEEFAPRELAAVLAALLEGPWTGVPRIVT